ncbi:hypothetical protein Tco_0323994 [Tanacetum coccineum]
MELCTNLQNRVIDLEKTKTSQAQEITSLKRRVKRLEKKGRSRTYRLKRLYKVGLSRRVESSDEEGLGEEDASKQGRIADINADAEINLVSTNFDADTDMFGVHDLVGDEITLAKALAEVRSAKLPTITAATTIIAASTRSKAKRLVYSMNRSKHLHKQFLHNKVTTQCQDMGSEVRAEAEIAQEISSKRAGTELEQESIKKQKVDEDKETIELQKTN